MKKKVSKIVIDYIDFEDFEYDLKRFRDILDEWIEKYGPDAYFSFEWVPWNGDSKCFCLRKDVLETDEEYNQRLLQEQKRKQSEEARDRKEFERLQKKYGESK